MLEESSCARPPTCVKGLGWAWLGHPCHGMEEAKRAAAAGHVVLPSMEEGKIERGVRMPPCDGSGVPTIPVVFITAAGRPATAALSF